MESTTSNPRWQRALVELRALSWWMLSVALGGLCAWVGWFAPSLLGLAPGPLSGGAPEATTAALAGLLGGALVVPVVGFLWFYWRAPWRMLQELQQRLSSLEESRSTLPCASVRFEFDGRTQRVRLHLTNDGGPGDFSASMTVDGPLATPLDGTVFAAWEHTPNVSAHVLRGETRTLHLATLDTSAFPFAHWKVRVAGEGRGVSEIPAMHTSVIGGLPDTQAPRLLLHVALLSAPDSADGVVTRVVALDPFGATLLTR